MKQIRRSKDPVSLSSISAALKDERAQMGLTQVQASKQFKISLKTLRNLEQGIGGVPLSTVSKILAYFGKELRVGEIVFSPTQKIKKRPRREGVLETLRLIRPVLEGKFDIERVALFGSCARDEAKKGSDIDLAISFRTPANFETIGKMTTLLEVLFEGIKVDLVDEKKMLPEIKKKAERDFIYVS